MKKEWVKAEKEMEKQLKEKHQMEKAPQPPETIPEEEEEEALGEAARRLE
jgi:hypothetical protein